MYSTVRTKEKNLISYANKEMDTHLKPQASRNEKMRDPLAISTKAYLNLCLFLIQNYF